MEALQATLLPRSLISSNIDPSDLLDEQASVVAAALFAVGKDEAAVGIEG